MYTYISCSILHKHTHTHIRTREIRHYSEDTKEEHTPEKDIL